MARPLTAELAEWVSGLRLAAIPERVRALVRMQVLSVLASAHAARHSAQAGAVVAGVRARRHTGLMPIVSTGERTSLESALLANAACGMAFDYDDYLFMGHTGHSAVWVPLLLGADVGAAPEDVVCAMVAANEVAGRLGAACLFGPQNGQLWSFIHLAGAACGAARVLGLDATRTADAIGIALAQPNYGLFPGFMGPGSKLLTAATPAGTGLCAAQLAARGLTGCRTIVEDPSGFLRHFSFHALPQMLSGWGDAWVTETLAIKPYPGCAYIDTTIDAVLGILVESGPIPAEDITRVDVGASMLTIEMDRLSHEHEDRVHLSPVNVNFNIPINVAVTLLDGELTARALADETLARRAGDVLALADRVRLVHDWGMTYGVVMHLGDAIGLDRLTGNLGLLDALRVRRRARETLGSGALDMSFADVLRIAREVPSATRARMRALLGRRLFGKRGRSLFLSGVDMSRVGMPFGARVTLSTRDGRSFTRERIVPRGSARAGDLEEVARTKWRREAAPLGAGRVQAVEAAADRLESVAPLELLEKAAADRGASNQP